MSDQVAMYWYSGSAWKETDQLYAYNSSSWKEVVECYIWDGSWKITHLSPSSLDDFDVYDESSGCDPTEGTFGITWAYSSAHPNDYNIKLDYSFDSGTNWNLFNTYGMNDSPQSSLSLNGFVGFTSLDNTKFRLRMEWISNTAISGSNSPKFDDPPYPC